MKSNLSASINKMTNLSNFFKFLNELLLLLLNETRLMRNPLLNIYIERITFPIKREKKIRSFNVFIRFYNKAKN